jgi:hypothetical protein
METAAARGSGTEEDGSGRATRMSQFYYSDAAADEAASPRSNTGNRRSSRWERAGPIQGDAVLIGHLDKYRHDAATYEGEPWKSEVRQRQSPVWP